MRVDPFAEAQEDVPAPVDEFDGAPLREFNMKFREEMEEKDRKSREAQSELRAAAKADLDSFYEQRVIKKDSKAKSNRESEAEFLKTIEEAKNVDNTWERVVSLVDVSTNPEINEKDVSRLRQILIQLKSHPIAFKK